MAQKAPAQTQPVHVQPVQVQPVQVQPLAEATPFMRAAIVVDVVVDQRGEVTEFAFDGVREAAEFRFGDHVNLLVMDLRTKAPDRFQETHQARLATQPIQFKDAETGRPIPTPELIRVHRYGDFCCALEIHSAVLHEQRYSFHLVVIAGEKLVGSPDPTVVIEPPPCTGPDCEDPPTPSAEADRG